MLPEIGTNVTIILFDERKPDNWYRDQLPEIFGEHVELTIERRLPPKETFRSVA